MRVDLIGDQLFIGHDPAWEITRTDGVPVAKGDAVPVGTPLYAQRIADDIPVPGTRIHGCDKPTFESIEIKLADDALIDVNTCEITTWPGEDSTWCDPHGDRWRVRGCHFYSEEVVVQGPNGDHCARFVGRAELLSWQRV